MCDERLNMILHHRDESLVGPSTLSQPAWKLGIPYQVVAANLPLVVLGSELDKLVGLGEVELALSWLSVYISIMLLDRGPTLLLRPETYFMMLAGVYCWKSWVFFATAR